MLKDKNFQKALELVNADPTPAKLSQEAQANLIADLKVAKDEYEKQAAAVKLHYNTVYEPMCAEKARLEIRMHELTIRVEKLAVNDQAFAKMMKLVMAALNKKTS